MAKNGSPLRKVTLEYDDRVSTLEGDEADRWMDAVNERLVFCHFRHGIDKFPMFNWQSTAKPSSSNTVQEQQ
jgi:hypothetical protein